MKLIEYLESIQELIKDRPELLEADVIYAIDDEGNEFRPCSFSVTAGLFEEDEYTEETGEDWDDEMTVNAVCIN